MVTAQDVLRRHNYLVTLRKPKNIFFFNVPSILGLGFIRLYILSWFLSSTFVYQNMDFVFGGNKTWPTWNPLLKPFYGYYGTFGRQETIKCLMERMFHL